MEENIISYKDKLSKISRTKLEDILCGETADWDITTMRETILSEKAAEKSISFIVDLLKEMKEDQRKHSIESATKENLIHHDIEVKSMLVEQQEELLLKIDTVNNLIYKFSGKRILKIFSLISIFVTGILLIISIVKKQIIIASPIPEILFISSCFAFILSKFIPKNID